MSRRLPDPVLRRIRCALSKSSRPLRGSWRPTKRTFGTPSCQRAMGTSDPQDVAFRGSLRSVAGGDDPDVVAAQAEVMVEELDVLGDPARFGVDVGAHETDLHARLPPFPSCCGAGCCVAAGGSKRGGRR